MNKFIKEYLTIQHQLLKEVLSISKKILQGAGCIAYLVFFVSFLIWVFSDATALVPFHITLTGILWLALYSCYAGILVMVMIIIGIIIWALIMIR